MIKRAAGWVSDKVMHVSGGRIRLSGSFEEPRTLQRPGGTGEQILDGTEDMDDDAAVELENR